jgi:hypothetical protein
VYRTWHPRFATLSFYASKDGKISVSFSRWDANRVVLEGQAFEVSWGAQGVEGRKRRARGTGDGLRPHDPEGLHEASPPSDPGHPLFQVGHPRPTPHC